MYPPLRILYGCTCTTRTKRLYVHNSHKEVVAFGDTEDAKKTTNVFEVVAVTGRSIGLDIASVCFSAFSVISLFGFFILEKRTAKTK
ncbi:hypothetical protein RD792_014958 [Penstemon davidsonii]|uniref:Uncharacterized protein n=1 Tax=Penstemon davidsonii TaxID=160366 RepID=A0ABR0CRP5_9LAMI|nr:hypothetical protein RD792_014958 [Penstemon davidsonii]